MDPKSPLSKLLACPALDLLSHQQLLTLALTARSRDMAASSCITEEEGASASQKPKSCDDAMHTHTHCCHY
jgi:hypothetical protein